jgi:hypothetical protein
VRVLVVDQFQEPTVLFVVNGHRRSAPALSVIVWSNRATPPA